MPTIVLGLLVAVTLGTSSGTFSRAGAVDPELATISGRVVDADTGDPVEAARVILAGAGLESRTDEEGAFSFAEHDVLADTLLVSHGEYHVSRVVIEDIQREHLALRIELRRAPVPGRTDLEPPAVLLREILASSGAESWDAHAFEAFLQSTSHPLELLLFSGLIEDLTMSSRHDGCVLIAGAEDCAALWLEGRETNAGEIGGWLPSQIERFWVVPPEAGIEDLGLMSGTHPGLVVILLRREGR